MHAPLTSTLQLNYTAKNMIRHTLGYDEFSIYLQIFSSIPQYEYNFHINIYLYVISQTKLWYLHFLFDIEHIFARIW